MKFEIIERKVEEGVDLGFKSNIFSPSQYGVMGESSFVQCHVSGQQY